MTDKKYNLSEWLHNRRDQWDNRAFWSLNASMIVNQVAEYEVSLDRATEALEEAVYLLNPTEKDMEKRAGVYRIVTTLNELKGAQND